MTQYNACTHSLILSQSTIKHQRFALPVTRDFERDSWQYLSERCESPTHHGRVVVGAFFSKTLKPRDG